MSAQVIFSPGIKPLGVQLGLQIWAPRPEPQRPWELPRVVGLPLMLFQMLRSHPSRRERHRWQGPTLPPGCVVIMRYQSR